MKYVIQMSLQQMTLVKIAEELWNREDISKSITKIKFSKTCLQSKKEQKEVEWQKIEYKVVESVSHLPLHDHLKKDLICLIRPIGHQISAWCTYHQKAECEISRLPEQFSWTSMGTIDRKRTTEMMVKDENLTLNTRYKLSCNYCLEDKISELWVQIPKRQKVLYYIKQCVADTKVQELVQFWSYQLVGHLSKLDDVIFKHTGQSNPHVYALQLALYDGNLAATEFFFSKLSDEERVTLLSKYAVKMWQFHRHSECNTDVFHFFLSRMTEDQQIQALNTFTYPNLRGFLDWPYQPFFVVSAKLLMKFIPEYEYTLILSSIISKIVEGWTDFDYRKLWRDFWRLIPLAYKRSSLPNFGMRHAFQLLERGEGGILKSIFKGASSYEKEGLMLSERGLNLCVRLVDKERWRSIEFFIELCGPSKEVMVQFKEGLVEWQSNQSGDGNQRKWMTLFQLIDNLIAKIRKK